MDSTIDKQDIQEQWRCYEHVYQLTRLVEINTIMKPTWLYIKKHNTTGLKYLGKTIQNPYTYKGSGIVWTRHLKKYGEDVTTEWAKLYTDEKLLNSEALFLSETHDVVKSNNWANLIEETGLMGGKTYERTFEKNQKMRESCVGIKKSEAHKEKIRKARTGVKMPEEQKEKIRKANKGKPKSEAHIKKVSLALTGKSKDESHRLNLSESIRNIPKKVCEHCKIEASPGNYKRWHGANCKHRNI